MSNTYMNELEQALKTVNGQLDAAELDESNKVNSAKINLYYAHGITEQASDKLSMDQKKSEVNGRQFQAATNIFRVTENIVSDANAAALDAGNTTSTVSTAATSFQTAANALTNLWADTAAVLAVATSVDNHDKIKEMAQTANALTERAAKSAEEASLISLNTTIDASQSRAANVVTQAGVVKNDMQNLEKALSDGFATLQDQVNTDLGELSDAIESESQKAGVLNVAEAEETALQSSESFMNKEVNHNLRWTEGKDDFGDNFYLSFDKFQEYEIINSGDICDTGKIKKTPVVQEYRMLIVSADEAPSFDIQVAKTVSNEGNVNKYVSIDPDDQKEYKKHYFLTEYFAMHPDEERGTEEEGTKKLIAFDYHGKAVKRGVDYCFFVYVIYTSGYQASTGDTDGYLSLASPEFRNVATLPSPAPSADDKACETTDNVHLAFGKSDESNTVHVSFKIPKDEMVLPNTVNLNMFMDFRVFLFSEANHKALCQNLEIKEQTKVVDQSRKQLDRSEANLQESEDKYNLAAANGADEETIDKLRKDITTNQKKVEVDEKAYKDSVEKLNRLYSNKISNFYIDDTVLENVPAAYGMLASQSNSENYIEELKEQKAELEVEQAGLEEQVSEKQAENKSLESEVKKKQKASDKTENAITSLEEENVELRNKVRREFRELERISTFEQLILELEFLLGLQENLPTGKEKEREKQKELLESIIADLQKIDTNDQEIEKLTVDNINRQKEINDLNSKITLNNTQIQIYNEQLETIPGEIDNIDREIAQYEGSGDSDDDNLYFLASNEKGDFTNNYGEPLLPGKKYTAMVFSVIKPSQSGVAPEYQSVYSKFSEPQVFNGLQIKK